MCGIDRLVVLAEELLTLAFREVPQDHQRIAGILYRLCGHMTQFTPARRPQPVRRGGQDASVSEPVQVVRPHDHLQRRHLGFGPIIFGGIF
jgi:hypothetical protein